MKTSLETLQQAFYRAQEAGLKISSSYAIDALISQKDGLLHASDCPSATSRGEDWIELRKAVKKLDKWGACMVDAPVYNDSSASAFRSPEIVFMIDETLKLANNLNYDSSSFDESITALKSLIFLVDTLRTYDEGSAPYRSEDGLFTAPSLKKSGLPTGKTAGKQLTKLATSIAKTFPQQAEAAVSASSEEVQAFFGASTHSNHTLFDSHEMENEWYIPLRIEREDDGSNGLNVLEEMLEAGFNFHLISALFKTLELSEVGFIVWARVPVPIAAKAIKLGYQSREYVILPQAFTSTDGETLAALARLRLEKEGGAWPSYDDDDYVSYEPLLKAYESFKEL